MEVALKWMMFSCTKQVCPFFGKTAILKTFKVMQMVILKFKKYQIHTSLKIASTLKQMIKPFTEKIPLHVIRNDILTTRIVSKFKHFNFVLSFSTS